MLQIPHWTTIQPTLVCYLHLLETNLWPPSPYHHLPSQPLSPDVASRARSSPSGPQRTSIDPPPKKKHSGRNLHQSVKRCETKVLVSKSLKCCRTSGHNRTKKKKASIVAGSLSAQREAGQQRGNGSMCYSRIDGASNHPYRDFPIQPDMSVRYWSQSTLEQLSASCSFICWTWDQCGIINPPEKWRKSNRRLVGI